MSITFEYPATGEVTDSITLDDPQYGNSEQVGIQTNIKIAMSGDKYSYKKTPVKTRLLLTFTQLQNSDKDVFIAFLITVAGSDIKYTDHNSKAWQGRIINEPMEFIAYGNDEINSVTIEFIGDPQ